jgi:SAM-dependent methyltransferase
MHFKDYALYYNLLYRDKNYKEEAKYIDSVIRRYHPSAQTMIDLGCGTGNHVFEFEKLGYRVDGIDLSEGMLAIARENKEKGNYKAVFAEGDVRTYRTSGAYDVVVSLFHVMSYQTTNTDLDNAFATAKRLMEPNAVFVFDCWYGPGVLSDLPSSRVKHFEDANLKVERRSTPVMDFNANTVDIKFNVTIENKITREQTELEELHPMRYIFRAEVEFLASKYGMQLEGYFNWMTRELPSEKSWYCLFVLKNAGK